MALDPARWARIELLYEEALSRPSADRAAFVETACGDDPSLYGEILAMLSTEDSGRSLSIERLVPRDEEGPDHRDPRLGTMLGPWRIAGVLGHGGTGTVYLVERADGQYEQRAALKLIAPGFLTPEVVERFRVERRILARLVHPNISRLIDGGFTPEGTPYLVMEYVEGTTLTTYCDQRGLAVDDRLRLFRTVCGAVQQAHRALVVHRDLKPSNIYVSIAGEVKLLDFGIAKLLVPDAFGADPTTTRTEHRALTPAYAAPEQLRGEAVTTATDVYALGVVLYELLTGRRPFDIEGLSPAEIEQLVTSREPAAPSAAVGAEPGRLVRRLRGDLDRICLMALRKEPERRYASVEQMSEDIERFLSGRPVVAQPDTLGYRVRRFIARNRIAVAAAASFVILLSAFAVVATQQGRLVAAERDRVRVERDKAQEVVQVLVDLFQAANPEIVPGGDRQSIGEFLATAEARVLGGLEPRADVSATMKHVLGQVHGAKSDYPRARTLLEQALSESRELHGADALETITVQIDLGRLLIAVGDHPEARALLEDALARSERVVGERHVLTARALHTLATTSDDETKTTLFFQRALAIRRALLSPDDPDVASTLNALAIVEMNHERYPDARRLFEEALEVAGATHGGRNKIAFTVTNDYATLLTRTGDFSGAEAMHRRALALAIEVIGPQSIQAATGYNNVATVLANQGQLTSAVDLYRQAYDRYVAIVGPNHGLAANAARNVGVVFLLIERPAEGRLWMERAVAANEAAFGPDARNTVYVRAQLANLLFALGRRGEALAMLEHAVTALAKLSPPEGHYTLADAHLYLGRALLASGRAAAAEPHIRATNDFRTRVQPEGHPQRAVAACDLAQALSTLGRDSEALALLETCVPRIQTYGLIEPSRRERARQLLDRLRGVPSPK